MKTTAPACRHLAILASFSGAGGVERMLVNLLEGFAAQGVTVDLLLIKARGPHLARIPRTVNIIRLPSEHAYLNAWAIARYLRRTPPAALLAAKHRALLTAVWARALARSPVRIVGRLGTTVSGALATKGPLRRAIWHVPMRAFYRRADAVIAVSQGVADDVLAITGLPAAHVPVVRNPVITPDLERLAQEPVQHFWFAPGEPPVILGIGRLTEQKDFATLLRAFAIVRRARACRLMILGEGRQRARLGALAQQLGISAHVALPGYAANPYSYLRRARLFVLSSAWEGSPNALTEALALGIPSVATDCPSGPRELLAGGEYGPLVPIGDASALAAAMLGALDAPRPPQLLKHAVAEYNRDASARAYLNILGLT